MVFQEYVHMVTQQCERIARFEAELHEQAAGVCPGRRSSAALRGVRFTVAVTTPRRLGI
jgi:hypothetical protein